MSNKMSMFSHPEFYEIRDLVNAKMPAKLVEQLCTPIHTKEHPQPEQPEPEEV